jgi:hypothetical protein
MTWRIDRNAVAAREARGSRGSWRVRHGHGLAGYSGCRHHGNSCAAGCVHRAAAITRRAASAQAYLVPTIAPHIRS